MDTPKVTNPIAVRGMKEEQFLALHHEEWEALHLWLQKAETPPRTALRASKAAKNTPGQAPKAAEDTMAALDFPQAYRRLCHHLALSRARGYSHHVTDWLQQTVQRGHNLLYRQRPPEWSAVARFIVADFPRLVRRHAGFMAAALLLLYGPALMVFLAVWLHPDLAHHLFPAEELRNFDEMYSPANTRIGRSSGTDLEMFGVYIMNNVGIAFRCFASGLLLGISSVYVLTVNGVILGGVAGHLQAIGEGGPFWRFVIGHSAFELTAIGIAGGAGLRLGFALLAPGRLSRAQALRLAGNDGARLALGAFFMLVIAAFIEAYWSSIGALPDGVKYGSGALFWLLVLLWLLRGGALGRKPA